MIRSNRARRATLKTRTRTQRAASRIARNGVGTLATHCIAAGLGVKEARSVAGSLRKDAAKAGVTGQAGISYAKNVKARTCTRYTPAEVARIAVIYRPRKPAYKTAAARLALAA
ncbi:MAG: hypothetical protein FWJ90_17740 [Actinomadura sp.]